MKRKLLFVILLTLTLIVTGCNNSDSSVNDHGEELVAARLEGSFTVTVRELIPDYALDGTTIRYAVVTYFQGKPFIIDVGDRASELEIGKSYTFTIDPVPIGDVSSELVGKEISYLDAQLTYSKFDIASFEKATEDESGINGKNIVIAESK